MINYDIEEYDIKKLEMAREYINQVYVYYYSNSNSQDLTNRLNKITKKLSNVISGAREYKELHDRFEKESE